ncbi:MAG: NAD(P)(+) transhydrogenase (Re/Si-specific) subunit beta [Verrucomicrobia bacterium]|nr:NAD(P)(+) transhydrogenase (Re/Si-specific) subunit beta [Verrucomicrobiota bacterium]
MNLDSVIAVSYIVASMLFVFGIKMLGSAKSARRGNLVSAVGMLIAIIATLLYKGMSYQWIIVGMVIGSGIGAVAAKRVQMTGMPELVGLFNGFGGLASLLVAWAEFHGKRAIPIGGEESLTTFTMVAIVLTALVGGVTFSGSMIAYGKLAEKLPGKPILYKGQQVVNGIVFLLALIFSLIFIANGGGAYAALIVVILVSLVLGVLSTIPIGGADMPVVICLLNSYSGIAACFAGFIIENSVLIVSGSLVGASGLILTSIMCKAMNRSLANVLFSGFGAVTEGGTGGGYQGEANPVSAQDAYYILEAAQSVCFVPGYGMAVAQAQHAVRELGTALEKNGAEVKYCIHPVAGRMPGHMNVLLAEANVPYEQLVEPPDVNPVMSTIDVAIVIGANDVVNPAAKEDEKSPLYGMPIIEVDQARTCIVLKRSLNPGFAGVDNPLFFKDNTRMLFGDAKATVSQLVSEFKESG